MTVLASRIDVSVLIPVCNEARVIRETVAAMRAQDHPGTIELLFMDGCSDDETRSILEELAAGDPLLRVFHNPGRTIPYGLNIGLAHARGEYVVRMDAHTLYPPNYVSAGIARLQQGDVEWVSGPPIPYGRSAGARRVAMALGSRLGNGGAGKWMDGGPDKPEIELKTTVFAGVWRREVLLAHGGWDEGSTVSEDVELAARFVAAGQRIVCVPAMGARYLPRESLAGVWQQYHRFGYFRARTSGRHPESLRPSQLLSPAVVLTLGCVAVPGGIGRLARHGVALYATTVLAAATAAARPGERRLALGLPPIFVTMHLGWGLGFLRGCARFGLPVGALLRAVGVRGSRA